MHYLVYYIFLLKIHALHPNNAPKITGMLLELPPTQLLMLLGSDETLRQKVNEAMDIILYRQRLELGSSPTFNLSETTSTLATSNPLPTSPAATASTAAVHTNYATTPTASTKKINAIVLLEDCHSLEDNAPLFYSPGKRGIYSPRQGCATFERINAFRNIGR